MELVAIKAVSQQESDDAEAALKQAQADVLSAQAALETARIDLSRSRVTAPIGGRIGRSSITPGALVTANQAVALATLQKLDPIHVDLTQSSTEALLLKRLLAEGRVKPGTAKVKLNFEDGSTYALEGKLQFSEVSVDQGTGSVTLRAEFPNPKGQLLPGMYVRASVDAGVIDDAMLVPQQAITRDPAGNAVAYVIGADNKLAPRAVMPRRALATQWLISEGLNAGDRVAVQGQDKARPGTVVTPVAYQAPPAAESSVTAAASKP
jgi:membrane fusion protein, multidrug efflux system